METSAVFSSSTSSSFDEKFGYIFHCTHASLILRAFETFDAPEIEGQLLSTKHHLTPHFQWNRDPLPSIMDKHEVIIQINSLPHWLGY